MTSRGRVIVLNGTSSSGKSTLIRALQARLYSAWLGVGIDTVVFALPEAYLDQSLWGEVFRYVPAEPGSDGPFRIETGGSATASWTGSTGWSPRSQTPACR